MKPYCIWTERNFHMEITPPPRWRKWLSNIARGLSYRPIRAATVFRELALLTSSGNWLALQWQTFNYTYLTISGKVIYISTPPTKDYICPAGATRQATYVYRNVQVRSRNNGCRGKAISIIYSECVFVALGIQYAKRTRHVFICDLPGSTTFLHCIS